MGLRCSLLGHDYGETTTERDREEQGGEVVVVERELQVCDRCGTEKVLSENTEVRTLASGAAAEPSEPAASTDDAADSAFSESADSTEVPEPSGDADATPDRTPAATGEHDATTSTTPPEHAPEPGEDDAVILEDDADQERDREQWPDEAQQEALSETADTDDDPEPSPWPDQDGDDDEGFDAKPAAEGTAEEAGDVDFGGGLTPESAEPGDAGDEGYVEAPSEESGEAAAGPGAGRPGRSGAPSESTKKFGGSPPPAESPRRDDAVEVEDPGFTSAGPVNPPTGNTDDGDSVLVCPECGFERRAARASLRAGDICPDCRKGYLAERR